METDSLTFCYFWRGLRPGVSPLSREFTLQAKLDKVSSQNTGILTILPTSLHLLDIFPTGIAKGIFQEPFWWRQLAHKEIPPYWQQLIIQLTPEPFVRITKG